MSGLPATADRPLVGVRAWRATRRGLVCLNTEDVWPVPGVIDAQCSAPAPGMVPHLAPVAGCGCGAYAVSDLEALTRYLDWHRGWRFWTLRRDVVVGAVQMWGAPGRPVVVGEMRGGAGYQFRAPRARVLALAAHPALAGRDMGVPVVPLAGLELVAREIGGTQLRRPSSARHAAPATTGSRGPRLEARPGRLRRAVRRTPRFCWAVVCWSVGAPWRRLALLVLAYVAAYAAFPAFMGLVTALACVALLLVGWARAALGSVLASLSGR